jgi:hypothetical protein
MSTEEGDLAGAAAVADDAANDFCQTPAQKKKKGGRPLAAIKLHFNCSPGTKTTHNPTAVCKFCDTVFVNKKNDALEKHILEHCERLLQQLLCYSVAAAPFNKASGGANFKPRQALCYQAALQRSATFST